MFRRHFLLAALAALSACAAPSGPIALAPESTLIVVRHADRDGENLSAAGRERARALVAALDGEALDGIYSPGIQRNLDTAAPLSAARGLPVTRLPQETPTAALTRAGAGKSIIWVGNKGNIQTIWDDLSLPEPAPLAYGDLFFVRRGPSGDVTVERRHFGK